MAQADFEYRTSEIVADSINDPAGLPLTISIYADRARIRDALHDDAEAAGLRIGDVDGIEGLLSGSARALSDLMVIDCPAVSVELLAALSRMDARALHSGSQLIVSTTADGLEDVFGCLDQSGAQILVDPDRGERVIALGRVLTAIPGASRVRELSGDDRIALIRLTEQVGQIAQKLERLGTKGIGEGGDAFRFESPKPHYNGAADQRSDRLVNKVRAPLPDPRLVRHMIRQRQARANFFDADLFADPAWDILLDLTAARAENVRVSVTSLCIAAGVPPTTALRWISQMVESGLLIRLEDDCDKRRAFIALGDAAADAMSRYFADMGVRELRAA